jgi:predicted oxidoreductase
LKTYRIPQTDLEVSRIALGCMNMGGEWNYTPLTAEQRLRAVKLIETAYEQGINFFDHADIYAVGKSETVFGEVLQQLPGLRDKIILQSKCGIRFSDDPTPGNTGRYDFSRDHIMRAVEGSLRRLQTGYLDILLLHRPDPLVEPEEVAQAFEELHQSGMVRYFGVSNHTGAQMALLKRFVTQPLVINQVELNLLHVHLISDGIVANREWSEYAAAGGILDYCRLYNILTQAWAPLADGRLIDPPAGAEARVHKTVALVTKLAGARGVSKEAIVLAWLLRHPAPIQPIIRTTNPDCIIASCQADQVNLSREEWYDLFVAGRGEPVP